MQKNGRTWYRKPCAWARLIRSKQLEKDDEPTTHTSCMAHFGISLSAYLQTKRILPHSLSVDYNGRSSAVCCTSNASNRIKRQVLGHYGRTVYMHSYLGPRCFQKSQYTKYAGSTIVQDHKPKYTTNQSTPLQR